MVYNLPMKNNRLWLALLVTVAAPVFAQNTPIARHIPAGEAASILDKALAARQPQLASGGNYNLQVVRRAEPGMVEFHLKRAHVFFIQDGEATLVTGGTMEGPKDTGPGEQRGTSVSGGTTVLLRKGDVVTVPAATVHWFKDVRPQVTYYSVNIDQP